MSAQRFPAADLRRVSVELHHRDLEVSWEATDEVQVEGEGVVAESHGDEVYVAGGGAGSSIRLGVGSLVLGLEGQGRGGLVRLRLPEQLPEFELRLRAGDLRLNGLRGRAEVQVERGDVTATRGEGELNLTVGSGDVRIEEFRGPLSLTGGSGDKRLFQIDGPLSLMIGSGDLEITGGRGRLAVTSGSGDITLRDYACSNLSMKSGSGDIEVKGGEVGRQQIMTGSGDVLVDSMLGLARHVIETGAGDITVAIPRGLTARIEAVTSRGRIDSSLPLVEVGQRGKKSLFGRRLVGSIGEGEPRAEVNLRAASGDIGLKWRAAEESWTASSQTAPEESPQTPSEPAVVIPLSSPVEPTEPTEPAEPPVASPGLVAENGGDPRRAILEALAAGTITADEAARLLDAWSPAG